MRKLLSVLVVLAMCLMFIPATAETAKPTYTLIAECKDWGEVISAIDIEGLDGEFTAADFAVTATVTYFSYASYSNVTEEVVREVTEVTAQDGKIRLTLAYAFGDTVKAYSDSAENYKVLVKGEEIACAGLVDTAVDAFIEGVNGDTTYRLFAPATEGEAPLLVWLHGAGESGTDNRAQIAANMVTNWATPDSQALFGENGLYILAPQAHDGHHPEDIKAIIDDVIANYKIDTKRIYVGGCSMGGAGTISMLSAYPELFAAAFPICTASDMSDETAAALAANNMPVYFIHSIDDTTCAVSSSLVGSTAMTKAGGMAYVTLFDRVRCDGVPEEVADMLGHWSWTYVHMNFDCEGEDFDGKNYHAGEYTGQKVSDLYDGAPFDYSKLDMTVEGFSWYDQSTWTTYDGAAFDAAKMTQESYDITVTSVKPADIGYDCFFCWLAAQSK